MVESAGFGFESAAIVSPSPDCDDGSSEGTCRTSPGSSSGSMVSGDCNAPHQAQRRKVSDVGDKIHDRCEETVDISSKFEKILKIDDPNDLPKGDEISKEELDLLYARDMYELSLKERDQVYHDIHGIATPIEETPEFLSDCRKQLASSLESLVANKKEDTSAYEQALVQNRDFCHSHRMYDVFLRADQFKPKQAALRIVQFFAAKLNIFGPSKLTKRIGISDLSKEDRKSLESGFFQLLPVRDVAGRAIMIGMPMLRQYKELDNLKRAFYYMVMSALEDSTTQKAGLVLVGYNMGEKRVVDRPAVWAIQSLRRVLPMRVVGMHYCYDDFKLRPMMGIAMLFMGAMGRVRFRAHYGSPSDTLYKLLTFGIPKSVLPLTADGEPKVKFHRQWLKSRRRQEDASPTLSEIIVVPGRLDILLGRGKPIQEHFGNIRYHSLLDYYQEAYEKAKKFDKMQIAKHIVSTVYAYGGCFLKQEGAGWVAVEDSVARDKVSHAFRTRRASTSTSTARSHSTVSTKRRSPEATDTVLSSTIASNLNATTVTDEEQGADDSSFDEDFDEPDEKRAQLWASSFHVVPGTI